MYVENKSYPSKRFRTESYEKLDCLEGEFNGRQVKIFVITYNNKVGKIVVMDEKGTDKNTIKNRYNRICMEMERSGLFMRKDDGDGYTHNIKANEDISWEMYTHNKDYIAVYYQLYKPNDMDVDSNDIAMAIKMLAQNYSREELEKMSEKQRMDITMDYVSSIWAEKVAKREVYIKSITTEKNTASKYSMTTCGI